jgi:hypothetical protein
MNVSLEVGFKFNSNTGKIAENIAGIELKKKEVTGVNTEICYGYNTRREVDFVVRKGLKVEQLIPVCRNIDPYKTKDVEIKALLNAGKELKCDNPLVITGDKEGEEMIKDKKIKYPPSWKWLPEK